MSFEVRFSKQIYKFLERSNRDLVKKFKEIAGHLRENPFYTSKADIKKLKGKKNHFRLRIGKYRFLYEVDKMNKIVLFYDVDSRGDIYKQ